MPEVLLSGNHQNVARWRKKQSLLRTRLRRPDMYKTVVIPCKTKAEKKFAAEVEAEWEAITRGGNPEEMGAGER